MARRPRIDIPNYIYHVTSRGARQLNIFQSSEDRNDFLNLLERSGKLFPFRLHQYSLMTNHFHLLIEPRDSLSKLMQHFKSAYSTLFNKRSVKNGHLFQGRFFSKPVNSNLYYPVVSRYIHLNPVKAGIVSKPEDYRWSNYHALIHGEPDRIADPTFLLDFFGGDVENYREYVNQGIQSENLDEKKITTLPSWGFVGL